MTFEIDSFEDLPKEGFVYIYSDELNVQDYLMVLCADSPPVIFDGVSPVSELHDLYRSLTEDFRLYFRKHKVKYIPLKSAPWVFKMFFRRIDDYYKLMAFNGSHNIELSDVAARKADRDRFFDNLSDNDYLCCLNKNGSRSMFYSNNRSLDTDFVYGINSTDAHADALRCYGALIGKSEIMRSFAESLIDRSAYSAGHVDRILFSTPDRDVAYKWICTGENPSIEDNEGVRYLEG